MEVSFKNKKLAKMFKDHASLAKEYGDEMAHKIGERMQRLEKASSLGDLWPPYRKPDRCHEMTGDRQGQLSVDLKHPRRLLFVPDHDPIPTRNPPQGGLDWDRVIRVKIIAVEDTH